VGPRSRARQAFADLQSAGSPKGGIMKEAVNLLASWGWIFAALVGVAWRPRAGPAEPYISKEGASAALHRSAQLLYVSALFAGVLLIAVLCGLLASSMAGQGWLASCLAILLFMAIGANLADEGFGDGK
jgi:hypothetical protein